MEVFAAWQKRTKIAAEIISNAQENLAQNAIICARQLAGPKSPVHFIFAGGTLLKQPRFMQQLGAQNPKTRPGSIVSPLEREGPGAPWPWPEKPGTPDRPHRRHTKLRALNTAQPATPEISLSDFGIIFTTERRNPRSRHLDKLSVAGAIKLMLSEDAKVPQAILP